MICKFKSCAAMAAGAELGQQFPLAFSFLLLTTAAYWPPARAKRRATSIALVAKFKIPKKISGACMKT